MNWPSRDHFDGVSLRLFGSSNVVIARFSPDGRWIVYSALSRESGTGGVFVQPFLGPGLRAQIAKEGTFPEWRKDGREIVYYHGGSIWSVQVGLSGGMLRFRSPETLFSGFRLPAGFNANVRPFAVSRDGSRIYAVQAVEQADSNMIHVKLGW